MSQKDRGSPIPGHENIKRKRNGKFLVDHNPTNPFTGERNRRRTKTTETLAEAKTVLAQFTREFQEHIGYFPAGDDPIPGTVTLDDMVKLRLAKSREAASYADIKRNLGVVVEILGGNRRIVTINEETVAWFIEQAKKRRSKNPPHDFLSNKTVWDLVQLLMSMLRMGQRKGWLRCLPEYSFKKAFGRRQITVDLESYLKMLEQLPGAPQPDRAMALMALFTGQRLNDLRTMRWEQVQGKRVSYLSSKTQRDDLVIQEAPHELLSEVNALRNNVWQVSLQDYLDALQHIPGAPRSRRALVMALLATGIKIGDVHDLTWRQVNMSKRVIQYGEQTIPIPNLLYSELQGLPRKYPLIFVNPKGKQWHKNAAFDWIKVACKKQGIPILTPREMRRLAVNASDPLAPEWASDLESENNDYIFLNPKSSAPWSAHAVRQHIQVACEQAGVPYHTPHQWRHLATTAGLEITGDPDLIQRWIGWLDRRMLMTYGKMGDRATGLMNALAHKVTETRRTIFEPEINHPNVVSFAQFQNRRTG